MRCFACGFKMQDRPEVCPRCQVRLDRASVMRHFAITVVYALVAILIVALIAYLVLAWLDARMVATP